MMNDLLRDMVKAGDIVVFIDDVMVGTENIMILWKKY